MQSLCTVFIDNTIVQSKESHVSIYDIHIRPVFQLPCRLASFDSPFISMNTAVPVTRIGSFEAYCSERSIRSHLIAGVHARLVINQA